MVLRLDELMTNIFETFVINSNKQKKMKMLYGLYK